jgi:hypothetical protein
LKEKLDTLKAGTKLVSKEDKARAEKAYNQMRVHKQIPSVCIYFVWDLSLFILFLERVAKSQKKGM